MMTFQERLEKCEIEIRAGHTAQVARLMSEVNSAKVPRELRLPFANVCRRAGLVNIGIRILAPVIHHEKNLWRADATSQELAEYAVLLQKCGAIGEALQTLQRVDTAKVPLALLYQSFCLFNLWDYTSAIPLLERYVRTDLTEYSKLVGQVNLAAAYIETNRVFDARALLQEAIETAQKSGLGRLQANCLELSAQLNIRTGNYHAARTCLEQAAALLAQDKTTDQLFVEKWSAVLGSLESGSVDSLLKFRDEAERRGHWESVREADFYMLKVNFDAKRFHYLLFGTPHAGYRTRVYQELGQKAQNQVYIVGSSEGRILDLSDGALEGGPGLNSGKAVHRTLKILLKDFYRPIRLGALFSELFPGEHFDINSSPGRVHQVLHRTRAWLRDNEIPVSISADEGNCRLKIEGRFGFKVQLDGSSRITSLDIQLDRLFERFGESDFSAREARQILKIPLTSFNRVINLGLEQGRLCRLGSGPATRYEFTIKYPKMSVAA